MTRIMPVVPKWRRANVAGLAVGVDLENKILRGYVVAQLGPFKDRRGEFDERSLQSIVQLGNRHPSGLKSRFNHPTLSDDAPGKHLGRAKGFRMDKVQVLNDGQRKELKAVRADLHFTESSFDTPSGDLGGYVLRLAAEDADAISSSLVLSTEQEVRLERDGTPKRDAAGKDLPPLWRPTVLYASDIVSEGAAVDGILSIDQLGSLSSGALPDQVVRASSGILDKLFAGQPREVVEARVKAWLGRYLELRFGSRLSHPPASDDVRRSIAYRRRQLELVQLNAPAM